LLCVDYELDDDSKQDYDKNDAEVLTGGHPQVRLYGLVRVSRVGWQRWLSFRRLSVLFFSGITKS